MEESKNNIENILFQFISYIKEFHNYLVFQFNLDDISYNCSVKAFPKKGTLLIQDKTVDYLFHGRGCSITWEGMGINYNVDAVSLHGIIVGAYGIGQFISTLPDRQELDLYTFEEMNQALQFLEDKGVLMRRLPSDLGSLRVNEVWYDAVKNGLEFAGENKEEIEWG